MLTKQHELFRHADICQWRHAALNMWQTSESFGEGLLGRLKARPRTEQSDDWTDETGYIYSKVRKKYTF